MGWCGPKPLTLAEFPNITQFSFWLFHGFLPRSVEDSSPRIRDRLHGIELCSFDSLPGGLTVGIEPSSPDGVLRRDKRISAACIWSRG